MTLKTKRKIIFKVFCVFYSCFVFPTMLFLLLQTQLVPNCANEVMSSKDFQDSLIATLITEMATLSLEPVCREAGRISASAS